MVLLSFDHCEWAKNIGFILNYCLLIANDFVQPTSCNINRFLRVKLFDTAVKKIPTNFETMLVPGN